jgi:hypothetical protein
MRGKVSDFQVMRSLRMAFGSRLEFQNTAAGQPVLVTSTDLANAATAATYVSALTATEAEVNAVCDNNTATAAEIIQAADVSTRIVSETTATRAIAAATDNGKTVMLNRAAGITLTLPAPISGFRARYVVGTAPTSGGGEIGYVFVTTGGNDIMVINGLTSDGTAAVTDDNADTMTLIKSVAVKGDSVEVECDGTSWYMFVRTKLTNALTSSTT